MLQQKEAKTCLFCDKPIKGRSDKKFCDDYCRVAYNNALRAIANTQMRDVNNALSKNRRILEDLLPAGKETSKTTQEKLLQKGFLFKYITHLSVNKSGNTCYYCYDYGYLPLDKDWYLIVRRKEE
ncbi:MAG: hypothetical protein JWM28_4001 [Chitinophagaceae bacterium]|nr:hypothetical protein [Chitinophagaceae bacterium]